MIRKLNYIEPIPKSRQSRRDGGESGGVLLGGRALGRVPSVKGSPGRTEHRRITRFWDRLLIFFSCLSAVLLAKANTLGVDAQGFSPNTDQLDFITVDSSRTLNQGLWSVAAYLNYAKNVFLIYGVPITNQVRLKSNDSLVGADTILSYGVSQHLQAHFSIPWYLQQNPDTSLSERLTVGTGPNSLRAGVKYSFSGTKAEDGFALLGSVDLPNVRNDPYTGLDAQPVLNLEVAYGIIHETKAFGLNLGYRIRSPGAMPNNAVIFPLKNQIFYSAGVSYLLNSKRSLKLVGEIAGEIPAQSDPYINAKNISMAESSIALKGPLGRDKFWTIGGGGNILNDSMSPDYRVFVGFNMYFTNGKTQIPEAILDHPKFNEGSYKKFDAFVEDSDHDGVPDSEDECPNTPRGVKVDKRGCPIDSDGDGVPDYLDMCPNTLPGEIVDRFGCPVIPDDDFDGVPNTIDRCPDTPFGTRVDRFGCPITRPLPKPIKILVLGDVLFDFDKAALKTEAVMKLRDEFSKIKELRPKGIIIEGYTDSVGKEDYNRQLSMRRAQSVKHYMVDQIGFDPGLIRVVGFGKMGPVASNQTEEGRQKNRRVEVKIFNQTLD